LRTATAFLRTAIDIDAAYRGLSNGAQTVEIDVAETVSGNPTL
jgi:hypothetical protein